MYKVSDKIENETRTYKNRDDAMEWMEQLETRQIEAEMEQVEIVKVKGGWIATLYDYNDGSTSYLQAYKYQPTGTYEYRTAYSFYTDIEREQATVFESKDKAMEHAQDTIAVYVLF